MADQAPLTGPDFTQGVPATDVPSSGSLLGHANGEAVLLLRTRGGLVAIGATCSHYGSSLERGHFDGETLRCPWHHAAFDVHSGEAVEGPGYKPLPCWAVSEVDGRVTVTGKRTPSTPRKVKGPASVVILGGGAAGTSCAEELRRRGYEGGLTLVDAEGELPVDRPNLSKDSLAGTSPEDWLWLHEQAFYDEQRVRRRTGRVTAIDRAKQVVHLDGAGELPYGALVLAMGAAPIQPTLPGDGPPVFTLRSVRDLRALIKALDGKARVAVLGASFIGLEVASSLRTRGLEVQVIAPDAVPLGRVLGPQLGAAVRALHEKRGVRFHLGRRASARSARGVVLDDGTTVEADLIVAGVGVRPLVGLAQSAGLATLNGVVVDATMKTSDPNIWAVGDLARYPDPRSGARVRVEHWAVAQNQGRTAARSVLGGREPFRAVPFFWSQHADVTIAYVGHVEAPDEVVVEGDAAALDCVVRFKVKGRTLAAATVNRDATALELHDAFSRER
jgi:NADPH-dependent 2,4-dienoyl-CoA reductase/sulfur reductase-like enzyme/nitrite reductase/ring-hydroxylating ferredoxin subunit